MAYSVSSAAAYPNTEFYRASENRDSKFVQPEEENIEILGSENTSSIAVESSNQNLKSRAIAILSNTVRNVAVIETTRFLAIVGLVCSAVASVLLPALGFAAIAASACVWKNRVIQLDTKNLQGLDAVFEEVTDQNFSSRSPSIRSQNSASINGSIGRSKGASIVMSPISEEVSQEVDIASDIKEAFLNSWGEIDSLSVEQLYGLLTICYFYLLGKTSDMPESLSRKGLLKDHSTAVYVSDKYQKTLAKSSSELRDSATKNERKQNLQVNEKQQRLEKADPYLVMEIAQELHEKISTQLRKLGNKKEADRYADNARHAGEYIAQLKEFEDLRKVHFTEDVNNTNT